MTTLADLIARGLIEPYQASKLIAGICDQLAPVQAAGQVRYALTPETITVDDTTMEVSLADRTIPHCEHRAPETWPEGAHRHGAAEVYALGAMLTQLVSGEWPPAGLDWLDPELRGLAERMLADHPIDRPTTEEVGDTLHGMWHHDGAEDHIV